LPAVSTSQAQSPKIDSITLLGGPTRIRLRFETDSLNYYRVEYVTDAFFTTSLNARGLLLGTGSPTAWDDPLTGPPPRGFYRVRVIPRSTPLDTDGDGLNDVYELSFPACMNALVAAPLNASGDCDNDGFSNLQEQSMGTDPTVPNQVGMGLILNEVDYDQPGTDTGEFIEIYNASAAPLSLTNVSIRLINGANHVQYRDIPLSGTLAAGGYLVAANPSVVVATGAQVLRFSTAQDNIQNGAPDGIALINSTTGTLLDALAYEGAMTTANLTGFPGPYNLTEGTALSISVADSNTLNGSLIRNPNGTDTDNAVTDWALSTTITPGAPNVP